MEREQELALARTALSNLLMAVLRTDPLRGGGIRYPDLDLAMEEASRVLGNPVGGSFARTSAGVE